MAAGDVSAPRLGVINQLVWLCLLYCRSAGQLSVALGFPVVPKVFVYPGAQFVRFGVVALEQLDVPVHVGQGTVPIWRR